MHAFVVATPWRCGSHDIDDIVSVRTHDCTYESQQVHDCPDFDPARQGNDTVDDDTLKLLKQIGKKCPGCGMFIIKNSGCHIMNCGANAHASMEQGLAGGGCGAEFNWINLKPLRHGKPGHPANDRQVLYAAAIRR